MTITDVPFATTYTTTERDEVDEAAECWNAGSIEYFDFACRANSIVGKRDGGTERLAKKIRREVDTVERYAAAGALWLAMLQYFPSDAECYRNELEIGFWVAIGQKFKADVRELLKRNPTPSPAELAEPVKSAKHYFDEAMKNRMTVEKLRLMLPTRTAGESPFARAAKKIVAIIEKDILKAPALNSNMDEKEYKVFMKISEWMVSFLKKKMVQQ